MSQILVRREAISISEVRDVPAPQIGPGEILLAIEQFAVTANNVTYAAMGDAMKYWDFFPAPDGFGIVPVWGHAHVAASNVEGFALGERVYGYLPMASHLVVSPGAVRPGSFADTAPHRQHLAAVYNQYRRLAADPGHHPTREDIRSVFEPLFMTSWLIERMFARENWHGADTLVMTSASSKTALALAHVAKAQSPEIARIGLTSAGNIDFVRGTGLYDRVLPYDGIGAMTGANAVSVDFAGNGAVLRSVHGALGVGLKYSCLVGLTHWEDRGGAGADLPGPKPILFFAPAHMANMLAELGGEGFGRAVATSWNAFAEDAEKMVKIAPIEGLLAGAEAFKAAVHGDAKPNVGIVVRLTG
jgi:NADPH:quinone reductase-like Zn-dependent oxidoreductase